MKQNIRYHISVLIAAALALNGFSQNTSSPYSILGIGDIEESFFNRTSGMANTGIAYRSTHFLISNNPASYSALQDQFFMAEGSARGKFVSYYSNMLDKSTRSQSRDFSVNRFAVGIKVNKWWGSSVGLTPFSTANYSFSGKKVIQGTDITTAAAYAGTGGVNKAYWDNGIKLGKHFSVGVSTAFLFGSLNQTETLAGTDVTESIVTTKNIFLRNLYMNYGAQFFTKLGSKWDLTLGAVYAGQTDLLAEYSVDITSGSTSIKNEVTDNDYFRLPRSVGMGLSLSKNKKLTMLADYRYQDWATLKYRGAGYSLQNSNRASVGVELVDFRQVWPVLVEKVFYQAGIFYSNSYLSIRNEQLKDMGISVGIGFNSKRSLSNPLSSLSYLVGFEYGIRGTKAQNLIQERYGKITLTLSYKDFWFTKGIKYY
ncbi:MAG: hypothetical protein KF862_24860 [Chitinophagaceae bacterium]|nr:hypothetical protein [Chitinophagaceae bacterium]